LRLGSLVWAQISLRLLPSQAIASGARCHSGFPGTRGRNWRLDDSWNSAGPGRGTRPPRAPPGAGAGGRDRLGAGDRPPDDSSRSAGEAAPCRVR
jgi:hypothetical protein